MKKKARYIILIILLLIYSMAIFIFFGKDYLKKQAQETIIVIGNNTIWKRQKQQWTSYSSLSAKQSLNWKTFNTYIGGKKLGKYYLWNDGEKWYLFDNEKNAYSYNEELFAYKSNYNISVKEFTTEDTNDYTYLKQLLKENNISEEGELTISNLSKIDIDNDGTLENFYVFSNIFNSEVEQPKNNYSFVFMEKNNKLYMIYSLVDENVGLSGCLPIISYALDVDNDNVNEIVLNCSQYDELPPINTLYKFEKDKFVEIVNNK